MQVSPDPAATDAPAAKGAGLVRSSLVTSAATLVSRVLGLVREVVFAALFGDGAAADAYFVASKIPNLLRRLFAEGAFSQAFVPVLSEYRAKRTHEEIKAFVDHVAGNLSLVLLIVTIVGVLAAPALSALFAPGYMDDPAKFSLLVSMLQVTFPYLLLISLTGFAGAILNSYGRFAVPAMTPILLNVTLIAAALLASPYFAEPMMAQAWGLLLAGLIQLMFQLPSLAHLRLMPRPRLRPKHEGVKRVMLLMLPVMFSVSVGQINLMLDTVLATAIDGDGSVSWLYYSDRVMEFPLGIFGIAIATVILPALSRIYSQGNAEGFSATLEWGLRSVLVVGVPASAAMLVLAEPIVVTLYHRGAFGTDSIVPTARALQAFSLGLLALMSIKILASAYFSRQDTKTPVRHAVIAMVSNMVFNLILILPLAHVGLALATSMSGFLNAGLLLSGLLARKVLVFAAGWWAYVIRVVLATAVMSMILVSFLPELEQWVAWSDLDRIGVLGLLCAGGGLCYLLALLAFGVRPAHLRA